MIAPNRRFLASLAPILWVAILCPIAAFGQSGEPAKARVAPTAKIDPAVQRASAPAQNPERAPVASNPRPSAAVDDPVKAQKLEELLKRWEARSKVVESLDVKYTRYDNDPVFNVNKKFEGRALLMRPDFVYLDFFEIVEGKPRAFDERIVCDGKDVYQFRGSTKQIFIYPLPKDQQDKALNQGALPFLFDMSVKKAKERYQMYFKSEDDKSYIIQIIPLLAIDREEYSQAMLQLSKDKLLPMALKLTSPNNKETKRFAFGPATRIGEVEPADPKKWFNGAGMTADLAKSGWKVVRNPQSADTAITPGPGVSASQAGRNLGERVRNGAVPKAATKGQSNVKQR